MTISFDSTPEERSTVTMIARRFRDLQKKFGVPVTDRLDQLDIEMDLLATNANGCPLDFEKMLAAQDTDLAHDIGGIARHLDRDDNSPTAGKLLHCFLPRCAKPANSGSALSLTRVQSSQIVALGHDPGANVLSVLFKNRDGSTGSLYQYDSVSADLYASLIGAESVGSFFIHNIKRQAEHYPYRKIESPTFTLEDAAAAEVSP